jgi:hypothetical protein
MKPTCLVRVLADAGGAFEIGAVYPARAEAYGFRPVCHPEFGWLLLLRSEVEVVQGEARR